MVIKPKTPPMGWNSWNAYLGSPDEKELKATMRYIAAKLSPYGYEYCVTDAGWYSDRSGPDEPTEEYPLPHFCCDKYGRPWPHPGKYPSVAGGTGFLHISEYAHSLGLKFGLHMMRGLGKDMMGHDFKVKGTDYLLDDIIDLTSGCTWAENNFGVKVDHPAAQAYYDSLFENFAAWEIDFVKYDDLCSPIHAEEIEMIHKAIDKCGRDMIFSLSPGDWVKEEDAQFYSDHSSMWRISRDFWDDWDFNLRESFDLLAMWNQHLDNPGWPDADMIPIGWLCENPARTKGIKPRMCRLTTDEQRALFTLFSIARSPLILTCNLLRNTGDLLEIQTQPDCIAVNQRGTGNQMLKCGKDAETHLWRAHADGHDYLAFFNLTKLETYFEFDIPEDLQGKHGIDVWTGEVVPTMGVKVRLPLTAHSALFVRLSD